jgi:hypothetical protein
VSATPIVAPGAVVGGYRLDAPLLPGRVGTVYVSVDEASGEKVALRVVAPPQSVRVGHRLLAAAAAQAGVRSDRVVAVRRAGEEEGLLYVAMQLVDGDSLKHLLDSDQPPAPRMLLSILRSVAAGLDEAHAAGLAHGSVGAHDVLVEGDGSALIGDFGVAGDRGIEEDRRDFAALVYESLGGRAPAGYAEPEPLSELNPALPAEWDAVLAAALSEERPAPAPSALLGELEAAAPAPRGAAAKPETGEDGDVGTAVPRRREGASRRAGRGEGAARGAGRREGASRGARSAPLVLIAAAIAALVCLPIIGRALGGGGGGGDDAGRPLSAGGVTATVAGAWSRVDPEAADLDVGVPPMLAAGEDGSTAFAVALAEDTGSDLLPDSVARRLGGRPAPDVVSAGGADALLYRGGGLAALAIPTDDRVMVAGCEGDGELCARVLSTVRLEGLEARPFAADAEVVTQAGRTLKGLDVHRRRGTAALGGSRRVGTQIAAASYLARAYAGAEKALAQLEPGPLVARELTATRAALETLNVAYRRAAAAIGRRAEDRYALAEEAVRDGEQTLAAQADALRAALPRGGSS